MNEIMGTPVLFVNRFSVMVPDNNTAMTIGQRLKQVRKELGLTQMELAARVGLKQSTLSDLELGKSAGTTNLAVVANAIGVNALWLETGRGERAQGVAKDAGQDRLTIDTPEEMRLLTAFRLADDRGRDQLNSAVDAVLGALEQARRYK